jgi:hypothetical protein
MLLLTTTGLRRHLRRGSVIAGALLATFAATALAAGNSVHVRTPRHAHANVSYNVKLSGHAAGTKILYIFADYKPCASTPAEEHGAHHANGYIWAVSGDYSKTAVAKTPRAGTDHACAYLVNKSEPKNPSSGIVAHDFATYTVHP